MNCKIAENKRKWLDHVFWMSDEWMPKNILKFAAKEKRCIGQSKK